MIIGKVFGLQKLIQKFKALKKEARRQTLRSVVVGYTAAYALYVHESVGMVLKGQPRPGKNRGNFWDPAGRGQAKFLEEPARTLQDELGRVCAEVVIKTGKIEQGLLAAGLRLQRESMKRVPIDTGNLRASAYTRVE